ncbi:MAG: BRO family protein [Hyphomicrobiales bacterium]
MFVGATNAPSYTLISESGLYKLLLRSTKSEAKPFQDWITKEVIPTIRKTGQYDLKVNSSRDTMPMPKSFAEALRGNKYGSKI